jgi:hypothetical protein
MTTVTIAEAPLAIENVLAAATGTPAEPSG